MPINENIKLNIKTYQNILFKQLNKSEKFKNNKKIEKLIFIKKCNDFK